MRFHTSWIAGVIAAVMLHGAALAEVTISQSNAASSVLDGPFRSLFGAEKAVLSQMPDPTLTQLAIGRPVATRTTAAPVKAAVRAGRTLAAPDAAAMPAVIRYSDDWLAMQPAPTGGADWECMTRAIYFEARGESLRGQFAVAEVILNRMDSPDYPATVCGVVEQSSAAGCQFSFYCDGRTDQMRDARAIWRAERIARVMMDGAPRALTMGATHFHATWVQPDWSAQLPLTVAIGAHLFYRQP